MSLKVCGTEGMLEVTRGGWSGSRGNYVLTWKGTKDPEPQSKTFNFNGTSSEFSSFLKLVSAVSPYGLPSTGA